MSVKIIHAADFHMDSPFDALSAEKAAQRRQEQRDMLTRIAQIAEDERADIVLLAGDLFDSDVSYFETHDALKTALSRINAQVFIAPGNHDYYCTKSPYSYLKFSENVHIFKSPLIESIELPKLGVRVWGAGFTAPVSAPLLAGFTAPDSELINIMVMHGDTEGDVYNHISDSDIRNSNLDYLALGHIHKASEIGLAGKTAYAYPGCPEGRGFDETGEKGIIAGTVSNGECELRFVPVGGRQYRILPVELTGVSDVREAIKAAIPQGTQRDIVRIVLRGEFGGDIDTAGMEEALSEEFWSITVRNETLPPRDLWAGMEEDTLLGAFLRRMKTRYDEDPSEGVLLAVRYGVAALLGGEEPRT